MDGSARKVGQDPLLTWRRVLVGVLGITFALAGIALCSYFPGLAVVGEGLIGGGISLLMTAWNSANPSWDDVIKSFCVGAISGMVSARFSQFATTIVANVGTNSFALLVASFLSRVGAGMLSAYVTNGVANKLNGRAFNEKWDHAVVCGMLAGAFCFGAEQFSILRSNEAMESLIEGFSGVDVLRNFYNSEVRDTIVGAVARTVIVDCTIAAGTSALYEWLITGEVSLKAAVFGGLVVGGVSLARAGLAYNRGVVEGKAVHNALEEAANVADRATPARHQGVEPALTITAENGRVGIYRSTGGENMHPLNSRTNLQQHMLDRQGYYGTNFPAFNATRPETTGTLSGNAPLPYRDDRPQNDGGDSPPPDNESDDDDSDHFDRDDIGPMQDADEIASDNELPDVPREESDGETDFDRPPRRDEHAPGEDRTLPANRPGSDQVPNEDRPHEETENGEDQHRPTSETNDRRDQKEEERPPVDVYNTGSDGRPGDDGMGGGRIYPSSQLFQRPIPVETIVYETYSTGRESAYSSMPSSSSTAVELNEELPLVADPAYCFTSIEEELRRVEELKQSEEERQRQQREEYLIRNPPQQQYEYALSHGEGERIGINGVSQTPSSSSFMPYKNIQQQQNDQNSWGNAGNRKDGLLKKMLKMAKTKMNEVLQTGPSDGLITGSEAKIPYIVQIIGWSEQHKEYRMIKEDRWPKLPQRLRLVAITGVHGSGRTTLLHSLIYKYGYSIPQSQAFTTMFRMGVNLYVLPDQCIAFLDVCDSIDSTGDMQANAPAMGSILLEAFSYMSCDYILYSMPMKEGDIDKTAEGLDDWFCRRIMMHYSIASTIQRVGSQYASLVLRTNRPNEIVKSNAKRLHHIISDLCEQKNAKGLVKRAHVLAVHRLEQVHLQGRSASEDEMHKRQLDELWSSINEKCGYHYAEAFQDGTFTIQGGLISVWNELTGSEAIEKAITCSANKEQAQHADPKAAEKSQAFWDSLGSFRKKLGDCWLHKDIEESIENFKKEMEEVKEKETSPLPVQLNCLASLACTIIRGSLNLYTTSLQEEGIGVGLRGLTHVFSSSWIDGVFLGSAIHQHGLLDLLYDPIVFSNYSDAWHVLLTAASCGFRLRVLQFPLVENATSTVNHLQGQELSEEKLKIFKNIHYLLARMMNSKVNLKSLQAGEASKKTDGKRLNHERLRHTLLDMEFALGGKLKEIVEEVYTNPQLAADKNEEAIGLVHEWFDEYAGPIYKTPFAELDSREKNVFLETLHDLIYEEVALKIGEHVAMLMDQYFLPYPSSRTEEWKAQTQLIEQLLSLTSKDDELFIYMLRETTILDCLGQCVKYQGLPDDVLADVLRCYLRLMHAETTHSDKPGVKEALKGLERIFAVARSTSQVHVLSEIHRREKREKQIERYGYIGLHCLEKGAHRVAVDRLNQHCKRKIEVDSQENILYFVERLHYVAVDDEDRKDYFEYIYLNRGELFVNTAMILVEAAGRLDNRENDVNDVLRAMHKGCHLLNNFVRCYNIEDYEMQLLYKSEESDSRHNNPRIMTAFIQLIEALGQIHLQLIMNGQAFMKQDGLYDAMQAFLALLLNVQATSGMSHAEVKAILSKDLAHNVVAGSSDLQDDVEKLEILYSAQQFAAIDLKELHRDTCRAALLLNQSNTGEIMYSSAQYNIQANLNSVVRVAKQALEMAEQEKQDRQRAMTRSKQRTLGGQTSQLSLLDRLEQQPSPSSSNPSTLSSDVLTPALTTQELAPLACKDVYVECPVLRRKYPKAEVGNITFFREDLSEGKTLALMILFNNDNTQDNNSRIDMLIAHLSKLLKAKDPLFLKLTNDKVQRLLQLKLIDKILEACEHRQGERDDVNGIECPTPSPAVVVLVDEFLKWIAELRNISLPIRRLCSSFELCEPNVHKIGSDALLEEQLPPAFFTMNRDELSTFTIKKLQEMRKRGDRRVPQNSSNYVLVRLELLDRRMVQAIFHEDVSYERLNKQLVNERILKEAQDSLVLPADAQMQHPISNHAKYAIYLKIERKS